MKLEKIKLSGFKSFVDPTTIPVNGNLTGIVGPNGCGKSNIIDAVRWVMGESSAKHLRGGQMTDVIFNGSSTRQPVSLASVELIFDNSEGKLGGEYANYSSISIKRQVNRDGQSTYILNNSRCRRRDITDLFLGTGLGSRSYAIIEQGTISRMVEAKPEELREHIEEAAGISRYKEKRNETEIRMRHTQENLDRLNDVRDEVEKQLKHLKHQARKAEKYTEYKKEERRFRIELLAMRWDGYELSLKGLDEQLVTVAERHNKSFLLQREIGAEIEAKRAQLKNEQHQLELVHAEYYTVAAEVNRLDQEIAHTEKDNFEMTQEIERLHRQADQSLLEIEQDKQQLEEISQLLMETESELSTAKMKEAEIQDLQKTAYERQHAWQEEWQAFGNEYSTVKGQIEIQQAKIAQLENQRKQVQHKLDQLHAEQSTLSGNQIQFEIETLDRTIQDIESKRAEFNHQLEQIHLQIDEMRQSVKQSYSELHDLRAELHGINGKISSLELLQQHAMGKDKKNLNQWMENAGLVGRQRLAEAIDVDAEWEVAAETVLAAFLDAVCVENISQFMQELDALKGESLSLLDMRPPYAMQRNTDPTLPMLTDKIRSPWALEGLLSGVYCAEDIESANEISEQLRFHESVITRQGVWIGPGWLKLVHAADNKSGVLQREKQLRLLKQRKKDSQIKISSLEQKLDDLEHNLKEAENRREALRQQDKIVASELSAKSAEFSAHSARLEQQSIRLERVMSEIDELIGHIAEIDGLLDDSHKLKEKAVHAMVTLEEQKYRLEEMKIEIQAENQLTGHKVNDSRKKVLELEARIESLHSSRDMTAKQIERLRSLAQQSGARISDLEQRLSLMEQPLIENKAAVEQSRRKKNELDAELKKVRSVLEKTESEIGINEQEFQRLHNEVENNKADLDKLRFEQQEIKVRQKTVEEQLKEVDSEAREVLSQLPEHATEQEWKSMVDELTAKIEKLGPINLTAIEEYQTQSERMNFLNEQHQDLTEALKTLSQAINRIDRESRHRFKETFDKINTGLQHKFPKLFGGGQAYLDLTDQELPDSGVNIVAKPPGKRLSSIHLLSGGEKALTAVALVFSIFELNPAPFCLLDEVDAPLDDANVGRFSQMVEEMSESVQFLFISHNKVTMEIAKQLAGVTMKEPGVSRMVAVDIDEAVDLAES
ncbi:MAG: chromosome segregation protein SMC [Gammaproteobacteria bacterium]